MGGNFPRSALVSGVRAGSRYNIGVPPPVGTRMANAAPRPEGPVCPLTVGFTTDCEDAAPGARDRQPQSTTTTRGRRDRIGTKWPHPQDKNGVRPMQVVQ